MKWLLSVMLVLLAPLAACSVNPATGSSQFNVLSRDEEIKMGKESTPELTKQYGGVVKNQALTAYVSEVGASLAKHTEADNPTLPWEFTLLDSKVINAFALPGGKVFISIGLMREMTNEAQLAAVLGHEIGHVTARHINDQMWRQGAAQIGVSIGAVLIGAEEQSVLDAGQQLASLGLLKFNRDQESQADALGMRYMSKQGYDPLGALQVQQILQKAMQGGRQPELLSTHPYPETRMERIKQKLATEYKDTQNNPKYQLYDARFRERFLSKLTQGNDPATTRVGQIDLSRPATWCAHCAAEEAARQAAAAPVASTAP